MANSADPDEAARYEVSALVCRAERLTNGLANNNFRFILGALNIIYAVYKMYKCNLTEDILRKNILRSFLGHIFLFLHKTP